MRRHLRKSTRRMFSLRAWKVRVVFWAGAMIVGLVCALFAKLADWSNHVFLQLAGISPYLPLIVTPLGMGLAGWLTVRFFPGSQGSGIPQAIAALQVSGKSSLLSLRIAVGKILITMLGLMSGGSIGREGPSVHVGASLMYALGRFARFPSHYMDRGLILAGSAAGIAAAFNTPLAGVMFAIEEMSRSFESRTSGIVIVAVVFAGVTALAVLGPYHYFGVIDTAPARGLNLWAAVGLGGVVGGVLGGLFGLLLIYASRKVSPWAKRMPVRVALMAGLVLALFAFVSGYTASGTGYAEAKAILDGSGQFDPWYPLNKVGATVASYMTGIPGGIFAPALATGAGVGANLGNLLPIAPLSVMILFGMVGYFSGVVQSPLTAFVIVVEMTAERDMILPLLATAFIAYGASKLVNPHPLYHSLAQAFIPDGGKHRT
jgi:H+/Cl- antiporter ClcA